MRVALFSELSSNRARAFRQSGCACLPGWRRWSARARPSDGNFCMNYVTLLDNAALFARVHARRFARMRAMSTRPCVSVYMCVLQATGRA